MRWVTRLVWLVEGGPKPITTPIGEGINLKILMMVCFLSGALQQLKKGLLSFSKNEQLINKLVMCVKNEKT